MNGEMSRREHYRRAESIIQKIIDKPPSGPEVAALMLATAQVHATLATVSPWVANEE